MNLRVCDRPEWREESDVVRISVRQPLLFNYTHKSSGLHRVRLSHHAVFCCFRHSKCCLDLMSFVVSVFVLLCFCDVKSCLCHRSDFGSPALNVTAQFVINWCAVLSECFLADGKVKWRVWVKVKKEKTEQHYFPISHCEFFKVSHFLFFSFFFLNYLHAEGTVWHVDLEICVNVSTEIQFVKSDIRCSATEVKFSYQAWWPVSSSVQKAISVSIKRFCLSRPQKGYLGLPFPEKSGEKEHLWFTNSQAYVPPEIFNTWRLQHKIT